MAIDDKVDIEVRRAKAQLRLMDFIIRANIDYIERSSTSYNLLTEALTSNCELLGIMYKLGIQEVASLKDDPRVKKDYSRLEDTYMQYRLACMNKMEELKERN